MISKREQKLQLTHTFDAKHTSWIFTNDECPVWILNIHKIMVVLEWRTVYALTRGFFGVYFPSCTATRETNTKITLEWGQFVTRVHKAYIILFFIRHNVSVNKHKNDDFHTSSPCLTRSPHVLLMTSQSIAGDVTMTRQLWRDHVKSDM